MVWIYSVQTTATKMEEDDVYCISCCCQCGYLFYLFIYFSVYLRSFMLDLNVFVANFWYRAPKTTFDLSYSQVQKTNFSWLLNYIQYGLNLIGTNCISCVCHLVCWESNSNLMSKKRKKSHSCLNIALCVLLCAKQKQYRRFTQSNSYSIQKTPCFQELLLFHETLPQILFVLIPLSVLM